MPATLRDMDNIEIVNMERLAHIVKALSKAEIETLEILVDGDASEIIAKSISELEAGDRISIEDW